MLTGLQEIEVMKSETQEPELEMERKEKIIKSKTKTKTKKSKVNNNRKISKHLPSITTQSETTKTKKKDKLNGTSRSVKSKKYPDLSFPVDPKTLNLEGIDLLSKLIESDITNPQTQLQIDFSTPIKTFNIRDLQSNKQALNILIKEAVESVISKLFK